MCEFLKRRVKYNQRLENDNKKKGEYIGHQVAAPSNIMKSPHENIKRRGGMHPSYANANSATPVATTADNTVGIKIPARLDLTPNNAVGSNSFGVVELTVPFQQ